MTRENKELLLKDLCARLPYGVKLEHTSGLIGTLNNLTTYRLYDGDNIKDIYGAIDIFGDGNCVRVEYFRPYLFPISSMTEEQKEEYKQFLEDIDGYASSIDCVPQVDWLNKNHFDYRGLIPLGLAIDATDKNIY